MRTFMADVAYYVVVCITGAIIAMTFTYIVVTSLYTNTGDAYRHAFNDGYDSALLDTRDAMAERDATR